MSINKENYVQKAEDSIKKIAENKDKKGKIEMVTTTKIRKLLAMASEIYNEVLGKEEILDTDTASRISYLRMRYIYEYGRDDDKKALLRKFIDTSDILNIIKSINNSRANYILFYHYMESLIAFHKFYGGRD